MKMMPPGVGIWYADLAAITTPSAPKLSEITTGLAASTSPRVYNLSAAIATGYKLEATKSDSIKSKSVIDTGNSDSRGAYNYDVSIPLFQEALPLTNATSEYLVAMSLIGHKGVSCYLIKRLGKPYSVGLAVGDVVSVFQINMDNPITNEGNPGAPITVDCVGGKAGFMALNVSIVT